MAKSNPLLSSVNSGEFSPRMEGRVDFDRYPNAAKMCRNFLLLPQGGLTRRPGTRFVKETKDSSVASVLLPFQFSESQAYVIEAGDQYMRFYRRQARLDAADTDGAVSNGTFAANITGWAAPLTTAAYVSGTNDTSNASAYTFASHAIGTAGSNRWVVVCVYGVNTAANATRTISSVTVGGVTADLIHSAGVAGTAHYSVGGMYMIKVTSGTTANIVVTFSGAMTACRVEVFAVTNFVNVAYAAATDTDTAGTLAANATCPDNGCAIAMAGANSEAADVTGFTWTNLTEDADTAVETNAQMAVAHKNDPVAFTTETVTWAGGGASHTGVMILAIFGTEVPTYDSTNARMKLPVPGTPGYTHAEQAITIGAGFTAVEHVLKFKVAGYGGGKVLFRVGTTTGAQDVLADTELGVGEHSIGFTPGATTFYVGFRQGNIPQRDMYIDNVSLIDNAAVELVTPYASADVDDLRTFQAGDVMYILHSSYAPRKLERRGHKSWSLVEAFFEDGPYLSDNLSSLTTQQLITNPFFENGLSGWTDASAGDGHVFHTANGAELDDGTAGGGGVGTLRTSISGANDGGEFVLHCFIVNQNVTLSIGTSAGASDILTQTINPGWNSVSFESGAATIHFEFEINGHTAERSAVSIAVVYGTTSRLLRIAASGRATNEYIISSIGHMPFASTDVGRLVRMTWPGFEPVPFVINEYISATQVYAWSLRTVPTAGTSGVPTEDWALGAFSATTGYPQSLGFFDGRLILGNTTTGPRDLWFSQSNDLENMQADSFVDGALTVESDDAIAVTLASKRIDPIVWFSELNNLIVGTSGAQWNVSSVGGVVTPIDIFAKINSAIPDATIEPVQVAQAIIFAEKSRRTLYEMAFSTEQEGYVPEDITILADHIFASPAHQLIYQRRPHSVLWCTRDDGRIATMAYDRQHQILGWSQQILGGAFGSGDPVIEHVAIIPGAEDATQTFNSDERDEVWVVVKRTINGATKRYVEFFEYQFEGVFREDYDTESDWWTAMQAQQKDAFYVDSGITYDSVPTTTITGLTHLEGQTVKVWADGKAHPDKTVSGGQITLNDTASVVQVGLAYTSRYLSLKLATGSQQGTSINKVKAITGAGVLVLDATSFDIATADHDIEQGRTLHDLYTVEFRPIVKTDLTEAPPLFTGEAHKSLDSTWSTDPRIYIETDSPGPLTVLGIAPLIEGTEEST